MAPPKLKHKMTESTGVLWYPKQLEVIQDNAHRNRMSVNEWLRIAAIRGSLELADADPIPTLQQIRESEEEQS